ncbi:MAG: four helix bundle protein [Prevotella sp.]|nr:four helix bundle protein [Prevotella sp.]
MTNEKGYFLKDKSEAFAFRIIKLNKYLTNVKRECILSKQILRSGTSIAANIAESKDAQSTADYISKLSIALKEANETNFWVNSLYEGHYINEREFESLNKDSVEMIKLLVSSIKKVKSRAGLL